RLPRFQPVRRDPYLEMANDLQIDGFPAVELEREPLIRLHTDHLFSSGRFPDAKDGCLRVRFWLARCLAPILACVLIGSYTLGCIMSLVQRVVNHFLRKKTLGAKDVQKAWQKKNRFMKGANRF